LRDFQNMTKKTTEVKGKKPKNQNSDKKK